MIACPSCDQPVRIGSKYCHNCGSLIETIPSVDQVGRGRQKLIGIITAVLSAAIIGRLFSLWAEIVAGGVRVELVVSSAISIGLTILLIFFLYKGHWWARWLTAALLLIGSLILCSLVVSIFSGPIAPMFLLVLIIQMVLYGSAGLALLRSEDVAIFLQEQERKGGKL